jgi:hypothetical protein
MTLPIEGAQFVTIKEVKSNRDRQQARRGIGYGTESMREQIILFS